MLVLSRPRDAHGRSDLRELASTHDEDTLPRGGLPQWRPVLFAGANLRHHERDCCDVLARHRVLFGRQERSVQVDHYRGLGTPVSRVEQASAVQEIRPADRTMFWDAPVVEVRPLSAYDCLLGEVS